MKAILLAVLGLSMASCQTLPVSVNAYTHPAGVFVGLPLVPVEIGVQFKPVLNNSPEASK